VILKGLVFSGCLAVVSCVSAAAQGQTGFAPPSMSQGAVLDPTLMEALAAIKENRLAGVFSFVDPNQTNVAFANVLLYDHKALKAFVKFSRERYEKAGAITYWEKQVMLLIVGMSEEKGVLPGGRKISARLMQDVSAMALVPGVNDAQYRTRRLQGER
jgi:hypothetical protein